jgi:hypothetical protein
MVQDSLDKILALLICVVMLFVIPTMLSYQRQDAISYNLVQIEVDRLSERVREVGYLDAIMLKDFDSKLAATGNHYDIEFEHMKKSFSSDGTHIAVYYEGFYTDEIWSALAVEERYNMAIGDFFYVRVTSRSKTKSQLFNQWIGIKSGGPGIMITSGGVVRYGDT